MENEPKAAELLTSPSLTPDQQKLASQHIGLVGLHMKKRVPTPKIPTRDRDYDDLFQEGCVALVRAARRYDPERHGPFASFALPRVRGAIFSALHEYFGLVHIPMRTAAREPQGKPWHPGQQPILTLKPDLVAEDDFNPSEETSPPELIRHAIHRRFERAVRAAMKDLQSRSWPRRNPLPIMSRIAAERILISEEPERTPLRQIARDAGVSSSRAAAYEHKLITAVGEYLASDSHLRLLVRFATQDRAGFDGVLDRARRIQLADADIENFDHRFTNMPASDRAQWIYEMIEKTALASDEVARNLYRMVMKNEDIPEPVS